MIQVYIANPNYRSRYWGYNKGDEFYFEPMKFIVYAVIPILKLKIISVLKIEHNISLGLIR